MIESAPPEVNVTPLYNIETATDVTGPALIVSGRVLPIKNPPELVPAAEPPATVTVRVSSVVSLTEIDCDPVLEPVVYVAGDSVVVADVDFPTGFDAEPEAVTTRGNPESVPLAVTVKGVPAVKVPVAPVTVIEVEPVS